jgi:ribose/xylose/arabinose/galactoside ABC-type transport system permease subunit
MSYQMSILAGDFIGGISLEGDEGSSLGAITSIFSFEAKVS